jgi:hypothetical protein
LSNSVKHMTTTNMHSALYSIIWGQCSEAMQAKVQSDNYYNDMNEDCDSLELIKVIKGIAYKFESQKNIYLALDNAKCAFYTYHQGADKTNANCTSKFKNTIKVIEHYGGNIGEDKALMLEELKLVGDDANRVSPMEIETAMEMAKSKSHNAMAFLERVDKARYGQLISDLKNQFTRGTDQYPTSITDTYNLLLNY